MLLSHFNRELDKTAIIFQFLGKSFRDLEKLFLDRTFFSSTPAIVNRSFVVTVFSRDPEVEICSGCVINDSARVRDRV